VRLASETARGKSFLRFLQAVGAYVDTRKMTDARLPSDEFQNIPNSASHIDKRGVRVSVLSDYG